MKSEKEIEKQYGLTTKESRWAGKSSGHLVLSSYGAALPLPGLKKLINIAFRRVNSVAAATSIHPKYALYVSQNQLIGAANIAEGRQFSHLKRAITDFEFNTPISKKEGHISKDFEENGTDFEGFRMDFEEQREGKTAIFSRPTQKFQPAPAKRSVILGWHELCYIRRALGSLVLGPDGDDGGKATHLFH